MIRSTELMIFPNRRCANEQNAMEILFLLGLKLVTDVELSFDGFVDGVQRPATTLGELKLFEHSLCSHYPFNLGVAPRTQDISNNNKGDETQEVPCRSNQSVPLVEVFPMENLIEGGIFGSSHNVKTEE